MTRALAIFAAIAAMGLASCGGESASGSDATTAHADAADVADAGYSGRSYAGDATRGALVFETNCATCHGAGGRAGGVGPSLISEYERQNLARTIEWIEAPDPPMPHLYPSPLTERDVADVAAFVQEIR